MKLVQPTQTRPPNSMLAYGILEDDKETTAMVISALVQLCAGNVDINCSNNVIALFGLLISITHLYAQSRKAFSLYPSALVLSLDRTISLMCIQLHIESEFGALTPFHSALLLLD